MKDSAIKTSTYSKKEKWILSAIIILTYTIIEMIVFLMLSFLGALGSSGLLFSDWVIIIGVTILLLPLFIIKLQEKKSSKYGLIMILFLILDLYVGKYIIDNFPFSWVIQSVPILFFLIHSYILIKSFSKKSSIIIVSILLLISFSIYYISFFSYNTRLDIDAEKCFSNNVIIDIQKCVDDLGYKYLGSNSPLYENAKDICELASDEIVSGYERWNSPFINLSKKDVCYIKIAKYINNFRGNEYQKDIPYICDAITDTNFKESCLNRSLFKY